MDKEPLSFSWSIPSQNPNIIVTQHKIARVVVFWPRIMYVNITLNTVVRERPDEKKNIYKILYLLGVKVRNMKMDLNIYGTWRRVGQWTLMMKMYDFFIRLCFLVAPYNNIKKSSLRWKIFDTLLYPATKQLSRIKKS